MSIPDRDTSYGVGSAKPAGSSPGATDKSVADKTPDKDKPMELSEVADLLKKVIDFISAKMGHTIE